jgi:hypothetical protein
LRAPEGAPQEWVQFTGLSRQMGATTSKLLRSSV